jgi:hypothetical protein
MTDLDRLLISIRPLRDRLLSHPLYARIDSLPALRCFMEHHVFAVWDFMSLLKALQRDLTCVTLPWTPRGEGLGRRLVNEIVLAEESDEGGQGGFASHFELYLGAMRQAGANTKPVETFLTELAAGRSVNEALERAGAPLPSRQFVRATWQIIESGSTAAVAAAFALGREEVIPEIFRAIVCRLREEEPGRLDPFHRYLERHIDLDGDEHAPMALRMLTSLCRDDHALWAEAASAASDALRARLTLWDGVVAALP